MRRLMMAVLLVVGGCAPHSVAWPPQSIQLVTPTDTSQVVWDVSIDSTRTEAESPESMDSDQPQTGVWTTPAPSTLELRMMSPNDIPYRVVERRWVWLTVYNSDPKQTDDTPWTGASGRLMIPNDAASNGLPIGTRFRIPAIFGQQPITVEDRMKQDKGPNALDYWTYHIRDAYELSRKYDLKHKPVLIEILGAPSTTAPR